MSDDHPICRHRRFGFYLPDWPFARRADTWRLRHAPHEDRAHRLIKHQNG